MREKYEAQIAELEGRIAMMESGKFHVGERTIDNLNWVDTTPECIARDRRTVEMLKGIVERIKTREKPANS